MDALDHFPEKKYINITIYDLLTGLVDGFSIGLFIVGIMYIDGVFPEKIYIDIDFLLMYLN